MKPYYDDGNGIVIYHGDCRDVLPELGPVDLVLTDPPYGFGKYPTDRAPDLSTFAPYFEQGVTVALFGYPETLARWCVELGRPPNEWVTWWPTNKWEPRAPTLPRESEAIAIWGKTPGAARLMRPRSLDATGRRIARGRGNDPDVARMGDVWRDPSPGMCCNSHLRLHPNEKPLSLMTRLLMLCGGSTILDPFMGSGTTLRAAKDLGRRAIGIEIEERYCEIAARRLQQSVLPLEIPA